VVIEDIDNPVAIVIVLARRIIKIAPSNPAFPTTQPRRRYIITPRIVSTSGVKTPPKVFSFLLEVLLKIDFKIFGIDFIISKLGKNLFGIKKLDLFYLL